MTDKGKISTETSRECERRIQAYRLNDIGLPRLASQLYYWNQVQVTIHDLDRSQSQERFRK